VTFADNKRAGWLLVAGGVLVAIGSVLPWVTVATEQGNITRVGIDGRSDALLSFVLGRFGVDSPGDAPWDDGLLTVVLGLLLTGLGVVAAIAARPVSNVFRGIVFGIVTFTIGASIAAFSDAVDFVAAWPANFGLGNLGLGVYLIGAGATAAVIGSALLRRERIEGPTVEDAEAAQSVAVVRGAQSTSSAIH
jgi:hypothetical protein